MNQCPNCLNHIPEGELFCPNCGHEICLVPDYETLSTTLMQQQKQEEEQNEADIKEALLLEEEEKYFRKNRLKMILITVIAVAAVAITAIVLLNYWKNNANQSTELTAADYYDQAFLAFNKKELEHANGLLAEALALEPTHVNAKILKAKITNELGNKYDAISQLREIISQEPEAIEAYRYLLELFQADNDSESIHELLETSPDSIRNSLSDYISGAPIFSLEGGTYTTEQQIVITSTGERIYYTTDGTVPSKASTLYTEPVSISIGTTFLKAVSVNSAGVVSSVTEAEYYIDLNAPDAPVLYPVSGTYYGANGMISIFYPEDCLCYYSFDSRPDKYSRQYTAPVQMLEGDHIFYAIVVNSDGISSPIAAATYLYREIDPYEETEPIYTSAPNSPSTATATETPTPTEEVTDSPTPTPSEKPTTTPTSTPEPTTEPTPELTPEPTPELTPEPTPELTPEPTPEAPSPEATPAP